MRRPSCLAFVHQACLPLCGLLVTVGPVCQLGEAATGGSLQYARERVVEGFAGPLCKRIGLAGQRLDHHVGTGLLYLGLPRCHLWSRASFAPKPSLCLGPTNPHFKHLAAAAIGTHPSTASAPPHRGPQRLLVALRAGPEPRRARGGDSSAWVAIPVPDAGIPREWVERARAVVKDNARPPDAGRRFWELKSLLFCPCGRRLTTFAARRRYKSETYFTHAYVCSHQRRHGAGSCEHARYHNAEKLERRVRGLVLDLVRRPGVMMEHVREDVKREGERLRNADRERTAWAEELARAERRRDALIEMRADGDITDEECREKAAGLDARKATAKRELAALGGGAERERYLDALLGLVEEYVRNLPDLVHGTAAPVRDHDTVPTERTEDAPPGPYKLGPERIRRRTPEEVEGLRLARERERGRRYRAVYDLLGLKAVAQKRSYAPPPPAASAPCRRQPRTPPSLRRRGGGRGSRR